MVVVGLMAVGLAVGGVRLDATFDLDAFVPDLSAQSPLPDPGRNIDSRPGEDDPLGEFSFLAVVMIGSALAAPVIVMLIRMLTRPDDRPPSPRPAQEKPVAADADGGRSGPRSGRPWPTSTPGTTRAAR